MAGEWNGWNDKGMGLVSFMEHISSRHCSQMLLPRDFLAFLCLIVGLGGNLEIRASVESGSIPVRLLPRLADIFYEVGQGM